MAATAEPVLLSIIVNTYNRPDQIPACLAAIEPQLAGAAVEVLIVDDGGDQPLDSVVAPWLSRMPLRLLRVPHQGMAGARNRGVEAARAPRVLFLGDDVRIQPGCLARHLAVDESHIALTGPYPWVTLSGSRPFREWADPNQLPTYAKLPDASQADFKYFLTGNLSMDRAFFLRLGGFDQRYKHWGWEDVDFGLTFQLAGGRIIYDMQATSEHHHHAMSRADLWSREYKMGINSVLMWDKWKAWPELIEFMRFWNIGEPLPPPSPARRAVGNALTALLDRVAPNSAANWHAYERMIFSYRLEGVAEGLRRLEQSAQAPQ